MKRLLLFLNVLAALSVQAFEPYTPKTVPDPKQWGQEYYVSNPDSILSDGAVAFINEKAHDLYKATEAELCVVAVKAFDEYKYSAFDFSLRLFNYWGIGQKDRNTGILVFFALDSHDIQIRTGKGMEGLLPDITCGEIIDDYLHLFTEGDYSTGICCIVDGIYDKLVTPEAQAELMFGIKKKGHEDEDLIFWYAIIGFVILILLALRGYKKLNGKPGDRDIDIRKQSGNVQTGTGCLCWLFPFPLLFLYLYYRYARKHVKTIPLRCDKCSGEMRLLPENEVQKKLDDKQRKEAEIQSKEFIVWHCESCGNDVLRTLKGAKNYKFRKCPKCEAEAMKSISSRTITAATYSSQGLAESTYCCLFCNYRYTSQYKTPRLQRPSESSSGGSSWGGGGGSSRGSWGGGSSSGGGAGRKF